MGGIGVSHDGNDLNDYRVSSTIRRVMVRVDFISLISAFNAWMQEAFVAILE